MIRRAVLADYPELLQVYAAARTIMQQSGNPTQWGESKPEPEQIAADIQNGNGYVVEREGRICGAFALLFGADPTYSVIDGAWQSDRPYATLHRVASNGMQKGVLHECLAYCDTRISNLRIDTHENNRIMQHLLQKEGFVRCGTIRLLNGDPRIAYQRER